MSNIESGKRPSWWVSLIPFIVLLAVLVLVIKAFAADALEGGSQVALMFAAGVTVAIAMVFYGIPWRTLEDAMVDNLKSVGSSVIILLLRRSRWLVDDKWSGANPYILWYEGHTSRHIPFCLLHHQCCHCCDDRKFVDNHCYHWHRSYGYRQGTRLQ